MTKRDLWQGVCANGHIDNHWTRPGELPRHAIGFAMPFCQFYIRDDGGRGHVVGTCDAYVTWHSPTGKVVDIFAPRVPTAI